MNLMLRSQFFFLLLPEAQHTVWVQYVPSFHSAGLKYVPIVSDQIRWAKTLKLGEFLFIFYFIMFFVKLTNDMIPVRSSIYFCLNWHSIRLQEWPVKFSLCCLAYLCLKQMWTQVNCSRTKILSPRSTLTFNSVLHMLILTNSWNHQMSNIRNSMLKGSTRAIHISKSSCSISRSASN